MIAEPPTPQTNGPSTETPEWANHAKRIQELVKKAHKLPDPSARALLNECLETLLTMHGQGFAQIMDLIHDSGPQGMEIIDAIGEDPLLRGLLLIHGLHPIPLESRLGAALDKVRPYMESHGGNVELLSLQNDVARVRLQGACKTCPSSAVTMELSLRAAIEEFCPDLMGLEVEGIAPAESSHGMSDSTVETPAILNTH